MTTTTRMSEIVVSLLNFCIAILNVNIVEVPLGKEVFGLTRAILALVKVGTPILRTPACDRLNSH